MTVHHVEKDPEGLTMRLVAHLDATVERAWQLWADPRQFERWWGPPGGTVEVDGHDLTSGGRITFSVTDPDGEREDSVWEVVAADPPHQLELRDGDVDQDGRPIDGNALTAMVVTFTERTEGGAAMEIRTHFDSAAGMAQVAPGFEAGLRLIIERIDALLASAPSEPTA